MIGIITTIVLLMVHNIKDTFATMATSTSSRTNESCDLYGLIPENTLVQISSDSTSRPKPIQTTGKILDVVVGLHSTYALDTLGTVTQTRPNKPTPKEKYMYLLTPTKDNGSKSPQEMDNYGA
jgi:hypothetical protein